TGLRKIPGNNKHSVVLSSDTKKPPEVLQTSTRQRVCSTGGFSCLKNHELFRLMVDADNFKGINTRFGHLTGDFVLAEIAALLKVSIRGSDEVVRYGGDEFLILLPDTTAAGAANVAERIAWRVDEWNKADNLEGFWLRLSIGAVEWTDGQTLDEIL